MKFQECELCDEIRWVKFTLHGWVCEECLESLKNKEVDDDAIRD